MSSIVLHPVGTEIESGNGGSFSVYNEFIGIFVNVSAVENLQGDAVLNIQLQQSPNGTDWYDVNGINITSINTTGLFSVIPDTPQYITDTSQISWTIAGTNPSFTFEVTICTQ